MLVFERCSCIIGGHSAAFMVVSRGWCSRHVFRTRSNRPIRNHTPWVAGLAGVCTTHTQNEGTSSRFTLFQCLKSTAHVRRFTKGANHAPHVRAIKMVPAKSPSMERPTRRETRKETPERCALTAMIIAGRRKAR